MLIFLVILHSMESKAIHVGAEEDEGTTSVYIPTPMLILFWRHRGRWLESQQPADDSIIVSVNVYLMRTFSTRASVRTPAENRDNMSPTCGFEEKQPIFSTQTAGLRFRWQFAGPAPS